MVTIAQIRNTIASKDWPALRALHAEAKERGIQGCDTPEKLSTLSLALIENSLCNGDAALLRQLDAMLDAIERGSHPYDDRKACATFEADAAIAKAQIDSVIGRAQ